MSKNLLIITEEFPYPPTKGTWIDICGQIAFFSQEGWNVILAFRASNKENAASLNSPSNITVCSLPKRNSRWHLSKDPATVEGIQSLIDQYKPQAILCQYPQWASQVAHLDLKGAELWFRPHNFELAQLFIKIPNTLSWKFWKLGNIVWIIKWMRLLGFDAPQTFVLEYQMHHVADRLFFISYGDMKIMSQLYGGEASKKWILPFIYQEKIDLQEDKERLNVYYIGVSYDPRSTMQLAGATKLLKEIIPAVEKEMPRTFCFHVIGRGGKTYLRDYASDTVILHGFVEDLSIFLQQMDICCVPVEIGWGCKIKVVEAMAAGIPVVGASQAFHGLLPSEGAYFSCQTTKDYVKAFKALHDVETRKKMATTAKETYKSYLNIGQATLKEALNEIPSAAVI